MDYTQEAMRFRARKAARYIRLYGFSRTAVKIEAQYHMRRHYETLPIPRPRGGAGQHVGIIGCGTFAYSTIAYYLRRSYGAVIRGAMDVDLHRAASLARRYGLSYYTDDATRVLDDNSIDLVYIASNHASHAEYAIEALARGKHVHIEKPHVVSDDQLRRLCDAMRNASGRVRLGFNRPSSRIGREIANSVGRQKGPAVYNWSVAGHEIPRDHWYHREEEGGRVLGNLCHWTDFVYRLVAPSDRYPIRIIPARASSSDCDIGVSYVFADGTIAAITFSEAKGHAFEGVRERFAGQRGNALITMDDFRSLRIDEGARRRHIVQRFRDHGHRRAITNSYGLARSGRGEGEAAPVSYVWGTGELFLRTKEALDNNDEVIVSAPVDEPAVT
jgi:predicted dehydrogenase